MKKEREIFTLLELLIVISILLILISILLPALGSAREKGLTLRCSTNMKNMYTASFLYEADQQNLPYYDQDGKLWMWLLEKYHYVPEVSHKNGRGMINNVPWGGIFKCPAATTQNEGMYGMLHSAVKALPSKWQRPSTKMFISDSTSYGWLYVYNYWIMEDTNWVYVWDTRSVIRLIHEQKMIFPFFFLDGHGKNIRFLSGMRNIVDRGVFNVTYNETPLYPGL